jgi:hypothetical protein
MKLLSTAIAALGVLLFLYGTVKLAKSADQKIESPSGFVVENDDNGYRQFALRVTGSGAALCLVGGAAFIVFSRRRPAN